MKKYIGYNLDKRTFRGEHGEEVNEKAVREAWDRGELDCTQMVMRLITQFNWDGDRLAKFYEDRE